MAVAILALQMLDAYRGMDEQNSKTFNQVSSVKIIVFAPTKAAAE